MNNDSNDQAANDEASNATTITDHTSNNNTSQVSSRRGSVRKRKQGMAKMIIVGARVSGKYGELIENPRGPSF